MLRKLSLAALVLLSCQAVTAQDPYKFSSQLELGAIFTSGNTEDENVKFKGSVSALKGNWEQNLSMDGFRSSKQKELAAQRLYTVASSTYTFSEDNFILSRAAHEDDRFSGFDSQSDISVSYGQLLLRNRVGMSLNYTVGAGVRNSRSPDEKFSEGIVRLATNYSWDISEFEFCFMQHGQRNFPT
jgi:putative salt-induced outer membrane protein